jgi:hypothetical protein
MIGRYQYNYQGLFILIDCIFGKLNRMKGNMGSKNIKVLRAHEGNIAASSSGVKGLRSW